MISVLVGGFAFFFLGLQSFRRSLQLIAGDRIRISLKNISDRRLKAFSFGFLTTLVLQSSSETTAMLISLAGTGMLTLPQALAVTLGADIGATLITLLFSAWGIIDWALIIVAIGVAIRWFAKKHRTKNTGWVILGFGIILFGIQLISEGFTPLSSTVAVQHIANFTATHPFTILLIGTFFTAIVRSSVATIGITIALSFSGLIHFSAAVPIVLGANIGTCFSGLFESRTMGTDGRRVAIAHILVKVIGVAIAFLFISDIVYFIEWITHWIASVTPDLVPTDAIKISTTHVLFNIAIAILFLPFIPLGVSLTKKIVPERAPENKPFGPKYLEHKSLDTPVLAFAQVKQEILRVAGHAFDLFKNCLAMFEEVKNIPELISDIQDRDDKIDILDKAIRFYLAQLSQEQLSDRQSQLQYTLFHIAGNLEEIGDIVSKDLSMLAKKKWTKKVVFSEEGWKELRHFHDIVLNNFNLTISVITTPHPELHQKILRHQKKLYQMEEEYEQAHINRLHEGLKESFETSSIHLDLLGNLRRVNGQLTYIAKIVSEK